MDELQTGPQEEREEVTHAFLDRMVGKHHYELGVAFDEGKTWGSVRGLCFAVALCNLLVHHWGYMIAWGVAWLLVTMFGNMARPA